VHEGLGLIAHLALQAVDHRADEVSAAIDQVSPEEVHAEDKRIHLSPGLRGIFTITDAAYALAEP